MKGFTGTENGEPTFHELTGKITSIRHSSQSAPDAPRRVLLCLFARRSPRELKIGSALRPSDNS